MRATSILASLLLAACVEKPLDGAPGGALGNPVAGYAPAARWDARVEAYDARTGRFAVVPLYDEHGRPVAAVRSDDAPAEESALLSPRNARDLLHRYAGYFDLPDWARRDGRATVRVVLRAPASTSWSPAYAYSNEAYHRCLVARAERAVDLHDLGAHCSDRRSVTLLLGAELGPRLLAP